MWRRRLIPDSKLLYNIIKNIRVDQPPDVSDLVEMIVPLYKSAAAREFTVETVKVSPARLKEVIVDNQFASSAIKQQMKKNSSRQYKIGPVLFVGVSRESLTSKHAYERAVYRTLVMQMIGGKTPSPIIFATPLKKYFPPPGKPIGRDEINSGMTMTTTSNVYVMRAEEMNKVLVHELIHGLKFDIPHENMMHQKSSNQECTVFAIECNSRHYLAESYTEILAVIINCIMCAYEYVERSGGNIQSTIGEMLQAEIAFGAYQVAQILRHFSISSVNQFISGIGPRVKQTSDLFSYYIIKAAVFINLSDFLQFIRRHNTRLLKFTVTNDNITAYHKLIMAGCRSDKFISTVEACMSLPKSKSSRMTLVELI